MNSLLKPVFIVLVLYSGIVGQARLPKFEDYPIPIYRGRIHRPSWAHLKKGDCWRDKLNKCIGDYPAHVNFAGKYFAIAHSCGTECRYYTLTDLSTGRELEVLSDFETAEPMPKTSDGHEYLTLIFTRPNSRMMVAQYYIHLGLNPDGTYKEECRERRFIFDGHHIKPVSGTRNISCNEP